MKRNRKNTESKMKLNELNKVKAVNKLRLMSVQGSNSDRKGKVIGVIVDK